jgi:hypothetical protein
MPQDDPQIGEVWTTNNGTDALTRLQRNFLLHHPTLRRWFVVTAVLSARHGTSGYRVLSRSRQVTHITNQSLKLVWKFSAPPLNKICSHVGQDPCVNQALVIGLDKASYCEEHAPKHQPVYFPGDDLSEDPRFVKDLFGQCPVCKTPASVRDKIWDLVDSYIVSSCSCQSVFVPLLIQTTLNSSKSCLDYNALGQELTQALHLLVAKECTDITIFCGSNLDTSFINNTLVQVIQGTSIETRTLFDARYGQNVLMLLGMPSLSLEERDILHQKLRLSALWQSRTDPTHIIRVARIKFDGDILCTNLTDPSLVTKFNETVLREKFKRILTYDLSNSNSVPTGVRDNPNPLRSVPKQGEHWYNHDEGRYSSVLSIEELQDITAVKFTINNNPYEATLEEFQLEHDANQERGTWKVGLDYIYGPDHEDWGELQDIGMHDVKLKNACGSKQIPIKDFWGAKVLERKTVLDRVLDEASPFD